MPAETWDTIVTTYTTETRSWLFTANVVLDESDSGEITITLEDVISSRTWTAQEEALAGSWIPQTEL